MAACGGTDDFCGGGVSRPHVDDTVVGKDFLSLLGKADKRTQQLFDLMQPILQGASGQAMDILQGGPGPMAPAIQAAQGQAMGTLDQTLNTARENMARAGITGTDAVRIMTDAERQGGQQIAGIPSQFTTPILQQIMAALTGTTPLAVQSQAGALSSAGGVTAAQIQPVKGDTFADYMNAVANTISSVTGGKSVT